MNPSRPLAPARTRSTLQSGPLAHAILALALVAALAPAAFASTRCVVPDDGAGSVVFPPYAPPGYEGPDGVKMIESGLPPGTRILGSMALKNIAPTLVTPGGALGGKIYDFTCDIVLTMHGTGALLGFNFNRTIAGIGRVESAPGTPWALAQSVSVQFSRLQGQITGDPDFDLLRISGGTDFGMPSSGITHLSRQPNGDWAVDSFFDITYRIDFIGAFGGPMAGQSGSTTSFTRIQEGLPKPVACAIPASLLTFPPACLDGYVSPPDARISLNGLPPGIPETGTLHLTNIIMTAEYPGGTLGGNTEQFSCDARLELNTHGFYHPRLISFPMYGTCQTGPKTPGASVDGFAADLLLLQGQITGDPDFDLLRITAGDMVGYPSPGHTTLKMLPSGEYLIDSFFDIEYRVDVIGAPGGPFAGFSGSDVFETRLQMGQQQEGHYCTVPDVGGTATLPAGCVDGYESPLGARICLNGLPPGEPVLGRITVLDILTTGESVGGPLGGTIQDFKGDCRIDMFGTGSYAGYFHSVFFPVTGQSAAAPRAFGTSPQSVPMDLLKVQGQITGDPDFDLLRITAGTNFGMPSPGHTTLSDTGLGSWTVDSFFDISYRIDFIGKPGGTFTGMSGSTNAENRFKAAEYAKLAAPGTVPVALRVGDPAPNPSRGSTTMAIELPAEGFVSVGVYDVSGRRMARVADRSYPAGRHLVTWDGRRDDGARVAPGLYFVRVLADGREIAKRVALQQ